MAPPPLGFKTFIKTKGPFAVEVTDKGALAPSKFAPEFAGGAAAAVASGTVAGAPAAGAPGPVQPGTDKWRPGVVLYGSARDLGSVRSRRPYTGQTVEDRVRVIRTNPDAIHHPANTGCAELRVRRFGFVRSGR
eukprot:1177362-Prorocentrum_minimum.AAC.3